MPIICFECEKLFSSQSSLNRHIREVHKILEPIVIKYEQNVAPYKCLHGCLVSFKCCLDLRRHLKAEHNFSVTEHRMEFQTLQDFQIWLESEEKMKNVGYVKSRGTIRCVTESEQSLEKIYFDCVRSGSENIMEDKHRKRCIKSQGSAKVNLCCTSQIIIDRNITTDRCGVIYYPDHYGHENEIQHLHLSEGFRKSIASKLMAGVSATHILDTTRDCIQPTVSRDDLITRRDINNIKTSFNIALKDGIRHKNDATSVCMWIQECSTNGANPVLFFKNRGEDIDNCNIDTNDFVLVLMNQTQKEVFKKFGGNIVCVDGTHGLNAYNFELTTLLVVDEFGEGFPVAFLFSNRKDTCVYQLFFKCVKGAMGTSVLSRTFMSDITNVYYNAWQSVMGPTEFRLYCSWHMDRAWQQNLSKVRDLEKRKWVYQTLKYLQTKLHPDLFEKEYETFLNVLESDSATTEMFMYLKNNYFINRKQWAYCYRKMCGINTNMFLESMHKVIKYVYLEGKKIKRLDRSLHALQKFVRDKTVDRIIKLTKGKAGEHLRLINIRHRAALTKDYIITPKDNNISIISNNEESNQYIIVNRNTDVCCELNCKYCQVCIHMYECSCLDFNIKATICKHIHFLCLNTSNQKQSSGVLTFSESQKLEVDQLAQDLQSPLLVSAVDTDTSDLKRQIKSAALQVITNIDHCNYTYDEQVFMLKNLKVLMSMGTQRAKCITGFGNKNNPKSNSPPNKCIKKQTLFPTKRRAIKKKNAQKPNSAEIKIIKETLSQSLFTSTDKEHDHSYYVKMP